MNDNNTVSKSYKKENMYYIIREDGTSIFELPYREDFIYHCLIKLLDVAPDEKFRLLQFAENTVFFKYIPITKKDDLLILK